MTSQLRPSAHRSMALVTLTVQNSLQALLFRMARTQKGPSYYVTTAVLLAELLKLAMSLFFYHRESSAAGPVSLQALRTDVFGPGWYLLAVPASLYTLQNNLQYIAISNLDAATYQVSCQLKILTTALCTVWLLKRSLSTRKWTSLFILTLGIAMVQVPSSSAPTKPVVGTINPVVGFSAVIASSFLSGLAGVYFEKLLKTSSTSLWVRNVQLSLFSLVPAVLGIYMVDGTAVATNGFLYGYTGWAYAAIICQAVGGIIVALVVKYADNILKGFATSVAIILSCIASIFVFDFEVTFMFLMGASFVILATYLYGMSDSSPAASPSAFAARYLPASLASLVGGQHAHFQPIKTMSEVDHTVSASFAKDDAQAAYTDRPYAWPVTTQPITPIAAEATLPSTATPPSTLPHTPASSERTGHRHVFPSQQRSHSPIAGFRADMGTADPTDTLAFVQPRSRSHTDPARLWERQSILDPAMTHRDVDIAAAARSNSRHSPTGNGSGNGSGGSVSVSVDVAEAPEDDYNIARTTALGSGQSAQSALSTRRGA
ncbi:hypothetical protein RI367_004238 [Sorochytrium milnesiophthora]